MSRLIDIDDLKGCAIIRPTTHEEMSHILACKGLVKHDDIPTAYDVNKVVKELEEIKQIMLSPKNVDCFGEPCTENDCMACVINKAIEIVKGGGVR